MFSTKTLQQKPSDAIRGGLANLIVNRPDIPLTHIRNSKVAPQVDFREVDGADGEIR